jgi:hypothetical protein
MSESSVVYEKRQENIDEIPPEHRRTEKEVYLLSYLNSRKRIEDSYKSIREDKKKIKKILKKFPDLKSFVKGAPSVQKEKEKEKEETEEEKKKKEEKAEKKRMKQKERREKKKAEKAKMDVDDGKGEGGSS